MGELKKEIKKLQRHREQVKNWVAKHPDLLNKEPLIDARRKIEKEMERFKNFEKEVKTKTYSKVGLSMKKNTMTQDQQDAVHWITEQREILKNQQKDLEEQLDKIQRKRGKRKGNMSEESLLKRIDRHKWHVVQQNVLSKKIENGRVDPKQLDALKEDITYYVEEAHVDEDFYDNDLLYDGIEELEVADEDDEEDIEPSPPKKKEKERKKKKKRSTR